jgi:ATP-dependent RNA helicase RhlE
MAFKNLQLIEPILKALTEEGYTTPTPIQQQSIPLVLAKKDLLGTAQTGTGKTAAFAIPILQLLYNGKLQEKGRRQIKALILTPTRELAIQIDESFEAYGRHTGLSHAVIFGGVSQLHQTNQLRNGVDILIATPGRLLDLMSQGFIGLQQLQIFVLDEADRMLDMGFIHDVKRVIIKLPKERQTLFFSATMPPEIQSLANMLLTNPSMVSVAPVSSTVDTIDQTLYYVDKKNKPALLLYLLKSTDIPTVLVFTRTKHGADKLVKILHHEKIHAAAIHGNKSQNARQHALNSFKKGELRVLVATDIAARGIDIDDLTHVINFELPEVPETYVHRIGRTGRAGNAGTSFSFCDHEEKDDLRQIQKLIAKNIPVTDSHPFPLSAASFAPPPVKLQQQKRQQPQNRWGSGGGRGNGNRPSQSRGR